ncbi:ankyrin repeat-containing protein At5g02620-like [Fagus crenata]
MGNKKYVKLLLKNGNSPAYVKNNKGLSTFHIAAKEGNVNVMEELITTSPDIYELLDNRGQTALHTAIESGKHKAFEGLINEQDKEGNTPMHLAAIKGHDDVVYLLEKGEGLDLNAKNKGDFTTMDNILLQKELDAIQEELFLTKGARPSLMGALLKLGIRKAELADSVETARPDSLKEGSRTHLLVATLIATVTYTAAFTVPGGYQNQGVVSLLAKEWHEVPLFAYSMLFQQCW